MWEILGGIFVLIVMIVLSGIKVVKENYRLVVFRQGRLVGTKGPGMHLILPIVECGEMVDTRASSVTSPLVEAVTQDGRTVQVSAICMYQVADAGKAITVLDNLPEAMRALTQTSSRTVVLESSLADLRDEPKRAGRRLRMLLEKNSRNWGVKILSCEIGDLRAYAQIEQAVSEES
jgi:regulator of protease activity HflC (stomatin/prohibitin superfamily)